MHKVLKLSVALALCLFVSLPVMQQFAHAEEPSQAVTLDAELTAAHKLYAEEKYVDAVNEYKKLVDRLSADKGSDKDAVSLRKALQGLSDSYLRADRIDESRAAFERIGKLLPESCSVNDRARNMRDLAATFFADEQFAQAQQLCLDALTLQKSDPSISNLEKSKSAARTGWSYYKQANYKQATQYLSEAECLFDKDDDHSVSANEFRRRVLQIAAGCHIHIKDYRAAERVFAKLAEINQQMFGPNDVRTGWALFSLADAENHLGHHERASEDYRRAIWIFRKWNFDKLSKQYAVSAEEPSESLPSPGSLILSRLQWDVFGNRPSPPAPRGGEVQSAPPQVSADSELIASNTTHDPWEALRWSTPDAPGLVWADPTVPRKAILICVHGLSLHHGAYEDFAKRIAPAGYTVVAFDVRGFGSYNQAYGAEEVDFDACVADLLSIIQVIRDDSPGTPIFLMGESMGGAISLRVAATHESLIDGLISSVPAGKRFEEAGLKLQVAKKLFTHASRPFDIGTRVVRQATNDPELKARWSDDPMVRLNMSPKELLRFEKLCKRNVESASKIKSIPVIVYQGLNDRLIRPEGTLQVFHALATPDKDMMMLGNHEHLIFEEGQCPDDVLKGVTAWMDSRLTGSVRARPAHHHQRHP